MERVRCGEGGGQVGSGSGVEREGVNPNPEEWDVCVRASVFKCMMMTCG